MAVLGAINGISSIKSNMKDHNSKPSRLINIHKCSRMVLTTVTTKTVD